jgi:hypothetical protein
MIIMRKFMFAAVSAMVLVCVSNVFANQSAMQFEANNGIQSDSVVTDSASLQVVDAPVVADTTAASENTSSENVATETPADTASATTETVEAPADSAVSSF